MADVLAEFHKRLPAEAQARINAAEAGATAILAQGSAGIRSRLRIDGLLSDRDWILEPQDNARLAAACTIFVAYGNELWQRTDWATIVSVQKFINELTEVRKAVLLRFGQWESADALAEFEALFHQKAWLTHSKALSTASRKEVTPPENKDSPSTHEPTRADSNCPLDLDHEIEKLRAIVPVEGSLPPEPTVPATDKAEILMDTSACPEDPSPKNPAPVGHPAHRIWEDATHAAELDLARFKHRLENMRSEVLQSIEMMMPRFEKELLHGNSETYEDFTFKCDKFWEAWHVLYLAGIFHIWAERALSMVWDHKGARYHEQWLASYSRTIEETAKKVSLADERLVPQSFIAKVKDLLSRERIYGILRAREKVAAIERPAPEPVQQKPEDKGNIKILRGVDGKLKATVTIDVACRFGGVTRRAIEKAVKKGTLQAEGDRLNRRIFVDSLLKYFPPEDNAN